jgi:hypothetical protein
VRVIFVSAVLIIALGKQICEFPSRTFGVKKQRLKDVAARARRRRGQ